MTRDTTAQGTDYAIVRTFHNAPPLQTVEAPRFTVHAFIGGLLLLIACLGAIIGTLLILQTPAASGAPPAPSNPTPAGFEAVGGSNRGQGQ